MDNSLLAVRDINHKYIVVERDKNGTQKGYHKWRKLEGGTPNGYHKNGDNDSVVPKMGTTKNRNDRLVPKVGAINLAVKKEMVP